MAKKVIFIIAVVALLIGFGCGIAYDVMSNDEPTTAATVAQGNTTVEELVKQDAKYFDNMAGKVVFYESQVVLDKPFTEGDKFVAIEVTNIFQQTVDHTNNVYEFKHVINYGDVDVKVHKNACWLEDVAIESDSLKLTFDEAYNRAKQSDLVPSKSRFMTLRNPLGPVCCNPQYIIGNDNYGLMFVDSKTGDVSETSPAFPKK